MQCSKAGNSELETTIRPKYLRYYASPGYLQLRNYEETIFFRCSSQGQLTVVGGIQAFMHVVVTNKNEEDQIKNEDARVVTTFLLL